MTKIKRIKDITVGAVLGGMLFSGVSYAASATNIDVYFQPLKYFFDGVEKKAPDDQQGFIYNGTTYLPLRFVSEALGKKVGYEGKTSSIYVGKQPEGQKTFLSDMTPLSGGINSSSYFTNSDSFKTNAGNSFTHSIYGDRNSEITQEFLLNGNSTKFEAFLAPSETWSTKQKFDDIGAVRIYADDKLVYESGVIASNISNPIKIDVDIKGALKVKIVFRSYYLGLLDAGFIS